MLGDGNCIPRSIAALKYGQADDDAEKLNKIANKRHREVRLAIAAYMNTKEFEKNFPEHNYSVSALIELISKRNGPANPSFPKADKDLEAGLNALSELIKLKQQPAKAKRMAILNELTANQRFRIFIELTKLDGLWLTQEHIDAAAKVFNVKIFQFFFDAEEVDAEDRPTATIGLNSIILPEHLNPETRSICIVQDTKHCDMMRPRSKYDLQAFGKACNDFLAASSPDHVANPDALQSVIESGEGDCQQSDEEASGDDSNPDDSDYRSSRSDSDGDSDDGSSSESDEDEDGDFQEEEGCSGSDTRRRGAKGKL